MMDIIKNVQSNVQSVQKNLQNELITSSSGDVVTVTVNGQQDIVAIDINHCYLQGENKLLLQDLLLVSLNDALAKSREINHSAMAKMASDMNLPHIPGLF
jgi:hypothetical protein